MARREGDEARRDRFDGGSEPTAREKLALSSPPPPLLPSFLLLSFLFTNVPPVSPLSVSHL
jgi:hypothetical protein